MTRKTNVRKVTKLKRCVKAISPVIATLLMIAITVVASLVAYAWVTGYIGGTTTKVAHSIQIPSFAPDDTANSLTVYVQNVGQGTVEMGYPDNSVYVNDVPQTLTSATPAAQGSKVTISEGQTATLTIGTLSFTYHKGDQLRIKVVTSDGTSMQAVGTGTNTNPVGPAGPAVSLVVSGPNPRTVGVAGTVTVEARDASNNRATGYTGTVHFTSTDAAAVLPADSVLSSGVGSFSVTLNTLGSQSITATDTVTSSITGVQSGITVNAVAAPATHFAVSGFPTSVAPGTGGLVTVEALDASSNRATGYAGTVHITSSDAAANLPPNAGLTNGIGTFTVTLNTVSPPTVSITATDTVTSSITGVQSGISVTASAHFDHFQFSGIGSPTVGVAFSFTITAIDQNGATFSSFSGAGLLTDTTGTIHPSAVTFTSGIASATVTIDTDLVGDVIHVAANSQGGDSGPFTVALAPAVLAGFTFDTVGPQTSGTPFGITVRAIDQYSAPFTTYIGTNTLSYTGGTINPTTTTGGFTAGVWTGQVTVTGEGANVKIHTEAQTDASKFGDSNTFAVGVATVNIQFTTSGVGADTGTATVLTIDSVDYSYSQLNPTPLSLQWVPGTQHMIEAVSPVSGSLGVQYSWSSWSVGSTRQQLYTMPSSPITVTASYDTQYQLTMSANLGTTSPAIGDTWYTAGTVVSISATAPSAGAGEQYAWNGWTGVGSGSYTGTNNPATNAVTMNAPIIETASWTHQYQLTMATNFGTTSPAVGTSWVTAGSQVTISATSPTAGANDRYVWNGWAGSGTGSYTGTNNPAANAVTMSAAITETASWSHQWNLTVTASPSGALGATFSISYTQGGTPHNNEAQITTWKGWADAGTTATASNAQTPFGVFTFNSYTNNGATMNSAQIITLTYTSPQNLIRIPGFETDSTWTVGTNQGGSASRYSTTNPRTGTHSGQTNTANPSGGSSSASLTQTLTPTTTIAQIPDMAGSLTAYLRYVAAASEGTSGCTVSLSITAGSHTLTYVWCASGDTPTNSTNTKYSRMGDISSISYSTPLSRNLRADWIQAGFPTTDQLASIQLLSTGHREGDWTGYQYYGQNMVWDDLQLLYLP